MSSFVKTAARLLLFTSLLALTACNAQPANLTPTCDPAAISTQAAATVWAEVTRVIALTPTATITPTPTQTPTLTATPTLQGSPQASGTAGTRVTLPDQAKYVSQSVVDKTVFAPGAKFTMTWRLRNVGTTTWTTFYKLRFYGGNNFGAPQEIPLKAEVLPNGEVEITTNMVAPLKAGTYTSLWTMSNTNSANFNEPVYLEIVVSTTPSPQSATATATATPDDGTGEATITPTVTPSVTATTGS